MDLPQQFLPSRITGHLHLHQSQAVAEAPGPMTPLPQSAQVLASVPQPQPPPEKPLTKYAKQKLRREQKKREEDERARTQAEEERLQKLHSTRSGMSVIVAHQGLYPQLSTPTVELNKQANVHHPGSLSHQAHMQAPVSQVNKQHVAQIASSGLVATGQGVLLIPAKQEHSDLQSEQKGPSFQVPKTLDVLPTQPAQKSVGQTQLSETSMLPTWQVLQVSNAELLPGNMLLSSHSTAMNLAQRAHVASMAATSMVAIPPPAEASGLQSTVPIKQKLGQQRMGSVPGAGLNSTSMHPPVSATPALGQKKGAESTPTQQPACKKQKMSGAEPDQRIDELNDVIAVSGIDLKEEEDQLLIGPEEESRTTKAMRKIALEEEERLFLTRGPLWEKVTAIAARCGVANVSVDVGRCLSTSVEERVQSMLYRLINLSKQRCDMHKEWHKVVITSNVRSQLLLMERKSLRKDVVDKKLLDSELNEKKGEGSLPEVKREELKANAHKAQKEEEDRQMKVANVAARAAVGVDDMLLKWQMMAEQGRQKLQGRDAAAAKDGVSSTDVSASQSDKGDSANPGNAKRVITVKDVIAFLETEPQMSKSTLLYQLNERERKIAEGETGHPGNLR